MYVLAITNDGARVAYSLYAEKEKKTALYVVTATGGAPEKVCDDCGVPLRWSPDGAKIFYVIVGPPAHFGLLDVGSRQKQAWMKHPDLMLVRPSFSPDQRWLLFQAYRPGAATAKLYVAPLRGAAAPEENEWIQVTDHGYDPLWSPNGSLVYFGSFRDGHNCLWAQRLDASTKRPQGDAFAVHHFHNRALSVRNLNLGSGRFSLARDKLVFNLGQHTGNIWLTRLPD
jgi:Tol biopolymer transport system component